MYCDIIMFNGESFSLGFTKLHNAGSLRILECDETNLQQLLESKKADIIVINERFNRDSMHYRKSALNQVACKLAKANNIAIAFSFGRIMNAAKRTVYWGRRMQDIRLCRKYKVKIITASFARDKFGQRAPEELIAFMEMLGMTHSEAKNSLMTANEYAAKTEKAAKGVRIIG